MRQDRKKYVDVDNALVRMCGSKKVYARALNMFLDSREMEKFEMAVLENDLTGAGGHLHTLKGVAGNLSLTGLFEQSGHLMQKLRLGETIDPQLLASYRETYALTLGHVQALIPELGSS